MRESLDSACLQEGGETRSHDWAVLFSKSRKGLFSGAPVMQTNARCRLTSGLVVSPLILAGVR